MPAPIENREWRMPAWSGETWIVRDQQLDLMVCELPGGSDRVKKVRLAVFVLPGSDVSIRLVDSQIIERDPASGDLERKGVEQVYEVSWSNREYGVAGHKLIPREVVRTRKNEGPVFIQVVEVGTYTTDKDHKPSIENLG